VIELDSKCSAIAHLNRKVQSLVLLTQIVKESKGFPSKVTNFKVIALFLKLVDNNDWDDNFVFSKSEQSFRVREQN
jgi:hypothetical protein